jgi:hypothetical protein
MRTPRGPSRSLKSLHRIVSTSDVPFVTRRHTRVGIRVRPMCWPSSRSSRMVMRCLTCEPEGPCFALPVKARRAKARERLSSYREPASRNPQAVLRKTFKRSCTRAPFRLLPIRAPRQAVLRTSSWLAPSRFTNRPCDLPVEKTRDASNRCLPPKRTACTRTSRVPGSLSQLSLRGRPTETKAPCGITGGPDVSRRPRTASADRHQARVLVALCLRFER